MKYPQKYGPDRTPISQKEAEKAMLPLISAIREDLPECNEISFWLALEGGMWVTYADSVKHNCKGQLIKEFKI